MLKTLQAELKDSKDTQIPDVADTVPEADSSYSPPELIRIQIKINIDQICKIQKNNILSGFTQVKRDMI